LAAKSAEKAVAASNPTDKKMYGLLEDGYRHLTKAYEEEAELART
jgi:hypothetical protein